MKVRIIVLLSCVGGICSGITDSERVQIDSFGKSTLAGVKAVSLAFYMASSEGVDIMPDGLVPSQTVLRTKTELILRRNGIRILPDDKAGLDSSRLTVSVVVTKSPTVPGYALVVEVQLSDLVTVPRDTGLVLTRANIWPLPVVRGPSVVGENRLREYVVESVTTQLEMFCNDYLAANQPEPKPKKTYTTAELDAMARSESSRDPNKAWTPKPDKQP